MTRDIVWRGAELFGRDGWGDELTAEERDALSTGGDARALDGRVERIRDELEHGAGACLLRGFAAEEPERALRTFTARLGTPVSQSADGDTLLHVRDAGFAPSDPRFRGPYSNRRLSFHTDRCDVIAFLCVRPARAGGENHVLSSIALRKALREHAPHHAVVLERDALPYLRHTVDEGNQRPYALVPVFTEHDGRFAGSLLRVLIDRADASPEAPDLTDEQRAALDALEEIAEEPRLYASFRLEAGDLLLLNNWTTFHRRTAFEDDPDPSARRHLMRVWLSMPNSRPLDPRFEDHFGATAAGAVRGGMPARS
ncbi:MAG: TauD/TfdA family dioxygenase [Planctomycetota bacterium]